MKTSHALKKQSKTSGRQSLTRKYATVTHAHIVVCIHTQAPCPHALCRRAGSRGEVVNLPLTRLRLTPLQLALPISDSGEPGLTGLSGLTLVIDVTFLVVVRLTLLFVVGGSPFTLLGSVRAGVATVIPLVTSVILGVATIVPLVMPVMLSSAPKGSSASPAREQRGVAKGRSTAE